MYFTEGCKQGKGCYLSEKNKISYFRIENMGHKGSSGFPIIDDINVKKLDKILESLPPEPKRPPKPRRVLVSVPDSNKWYSWNKWNTRIYDRANMPEKILELSRITERSVPSIVLSINPAFEVKASRYDYGGLALSPDEKTLVSGSWFNDLIIWNPVTGVKIFSTNIISKFALEGLVFSPDGKYLVAISRCELIVLDPTNWRQVVKLKNSYRNHIVGTVKFTADGKFLVASNPKGITTFQTSNWQTVDMPGVPKDTTTFFSSDDEKWMVIGRTNQSTILWNSEAQTTHSIITTNYPPFLAAFSPDNRKVVIVSRYKKTERQHLFRIQVYDVQSGQMINTLSPNEMNYIESVSGLLWSSDSQYALAVTKSSFFSTRNINVWNVNTGRHRGNFVDFSKRATGIALTSDNKTLIAGCQKGKIMFWDFAKGMKEIKAFEKLFPIQSKYKLK